MKRYIEVLKHFQDQNGADDCVADMREVSGGPYVEAKVAERLYKQLKCCRDMLEAASWMNSGFVIFVDDADEALDFADNN